MNKVLHNWLSFCAYANTDRCLNKLKTAWHVIGDIKRFGDYKNSKTKLTMSI
jgi:hypothetical protein